MQKCSLVHSCVLGYQKIELISILASLLYTATETLIAAFEL